MQRGVTLPDRSGALNLKLEPEAGLPAEAAEAADPVQHLRQLGRRCRPTSCSEVQTHHSPKTHGRQHEGFIIGLWKAGGKRRALPCSQREAAPSPPSNSRPKRRGSVLRSACAGTDRHSFRASDGRAIGVEVKLHGRREYLAYFRVPGAQRSGSRAGRRGSTSKPSSTRLRRPREYP